MNYIDALVDNGLQGLGLIEPPPGEIGSRLTLKGEIESSKRTAATQAARSARLLYPSSPSLQLVDLV